MNYQKRLNALSVRSELLELPSSSPSEVELYEDSNFLCIMLHRIHVSSLFRLKQFNF